ncbi:DUF3558 family protein [Actinokineospora xionganensis]|uniref:DUF3558 family protein n=1 Tax=Actinokineospora xionganensis TaxID=2684470 RepID=A0ABR7L1Y5_9PSEU|nr:DUF3558 family protein [Actinokineospora xionganensis]MBC6446702.1 DUF3558 family protein [Actinokineospora xionganensis]
MGTNAARLAVTAVTAFAALALTACSEPTPAPQTGSPRTSESTETTTDKPSPTKKTTTPPKVDRPADKDLSAIKPCDVANGLKPADFGIDQRTQGREGKSAPFPGSLTCTIVGDKANLILSVDAVVTEGFASYTSSVVGNVVPTKIAGYPAAVVEGKAGGIACFTVVDTKDGQMMQFQLTVTNPDRQPVTPHAELCTKVAKIAEAGMKVVLAS